MRSESFHPLWPQLQTSELLADLQWLASEEGGPMGPPSGPHGEGLLLQEQQQQLRLIQTLEAADDGKHSAAVAAAAALFQCERQRQQLLQQVSAACFACELLRLAFLSVSSSLAPKRQQQIFALACHGDSGESREKLLTLLVGSICLMAPPPASQLPFAAQSLEAYWERVRVLPVLFEGLGPFAFEALDFRQLEKDVTRETFAINKQIYKGAEGVLPLLLVLCTRLREAETAAAETAAAETAAAETAAETAAEETFPSSPETFKTLCSLGLLPKDLCCAEAAATAAAATAAPAATAAAAWAAAARVFCAIRLLSVSSRTHGGGAAFGAALGAFACPSLPLLLQPDNQVAPRDQQQQQQQQQQKMALGCTEENMTEIALCCYPPQQEEAEGPLLAALHTTTPFKLLLPEHDPQSCCLDGHPQQQQQEQEQEQQQQQQELLRRLGSVALAAHFFATLRSVFLWRPSAELRQFDEDLAGEIRRRESLAALVSAALQREMRHIPQRDTKDMRLLWLPGDKLQQWVIVRCDSQGGERQS